MAPYQKLETIFERAASIHEVTGILGWDTETMMPPGAIGGRSEQLATLEALAHEIVTAQSVGELISQAIAQGELNDWQRANLREMERLHIRAKAVPSDLLVASTKASALCRHAWQSARKAGDFGAVRNQLAEVVRLQRETGEALGEALESGAYDALLDQFDLGSSQNALDRLFAPLQQALPDLIKAVVEKQRSGPEILPLEGPFATAIQESLCRTVLDAIGFDFNRGRLDVSAHPFTGGAFDDVRITTRFDEDNFLSGLMAVIHEGGHALYEQGRPTEWRNQPVGTARGMSIHESQALIFERQAARSAEFISYVAPVAREAFGGDGPAWSAENFRRITLNVEPGFIRVDADEVTYPAHILLRYEIERALISGDLDVTDLPGAFDAAVEKYLGLQVPDDRLGCLQDIHWYAGAFGYFPTYLVGAITAAQLLLAANTADPDITNALAKGRFNPLADWLRENIHSKASLQDWDELIFAASGEEVGSAAFLQHLERRYGA